MDSDSATTGTTESDEASAFRTVAATAVETTSKPFWMRHPGWLLAVIGFVIYMVIVPTIGMVNDWFTPAVSGEVQEMTALEWIRLRVVSGVVTLGFVVVGASIGSFLNVVIYRLPRKRPLLWPPSACANCKTRLSGKDNIPILAWMKLGGRCRYCDTPISARYPLVESIVAFVFVVFFFRELLSGGVNLPVRTANFYNGVVWILLYTKWDLVSLYFFHMMLLVILLAWGMINYDRFRVPGMSVLVSLGVFVGLASVFPHLNPAHKSLRDVLAFIPQSLASSLLGCVAGLGIGFALSRLALFQLPPVETTSPEETTSPGDHEDLVEEERARAEIQTQEPAAAGVRALDDPVVDGEHEDEVLSGPMLESGYVDDIEEPPSLYGSVASDPGSGVDVAASLALVGAAMGVRAVVMVALLTVVFTLVPQVCKTIYPNKLRTRRAWPATLFVFVASCLVLFLWAPIHDGISRIVGQ